MNNIFQFVADYSVGLVVVILVFFGLLETIFGYFAHSKRTKDDVLIETVNAFILFVITKPLVTLSAIYVTSVLFPSLKNSISHWFGSF